jgi:putative ABC transport system permease protein
MQISPAELHEWRQRATSIDVAGFSWVDNVNVAVGRYVDRMRASHVTPQLLTVLGVRITAGRAFTSDDERGDAGNAVIVSYSFWAEHLARTPDGLLEPIVIDREPYTIIGVLPQGFQLPLLGDVPVLLPTRGPRWLDDRAARSLVAIGRARAASTFGATAAELDAASARFHEPFRAAEGQWTVNVDPLTTAGLAFSTRTLSVMLALAWLVLLVACANVAILLLARIPARQQELAIRLALGAAHRRLVRQLLLESAIIATASALLGLAIARPVDGALVRVVDASLPFRIVPGLTAAAFATALALAAGTCALFGLAPAVSALRRAAANGAALTNRQAGSRANSRFRDLMLVTEVAFSIALLTGGWLMIASVRRMHATELGFDPDRLVTARITLDASRYPDDAARRSFWDALAARLASRSGLRDATIASTVPLAGTGELANAVTAGARTGSPADTVTADAVVVRPNYFAALGIHIDAGATFASADTRGAVIVNDALAKRLWPGRAALGQRLIVLAPMFDDGQAVAPSTRVVVGVAHTIPLSLLRNPVSRAFPTFYVSVSDNPLRSMTLSVRAPTAAAARAIREEVAALDPLVPVFSVRTSGDILSYWFGPIHLEAVITGALAAAGVLLTIVGVYSIVAVFVSQRRREIGVRIAIGARGVHVVNMVLGRTLRPALLGAVIGVGLTIVASRWAASMLYDTSPSDPRALVAAASVVAAVVGAAAAIPARRASRMEPLAALAPD